jgi:hypothetical protein
MRSAEPPRTPVGTVNLKLCLPAAWHQKSSAQSTAPRRELGGRTVETPAVPASGRHLPHRVVLILAVEETDILKARKAILRACGNAVEVLQCTRIRGTSRVRLSVNLDDGAAAQTVHHVMRCLSADEFGRVTVL